MKNSERKRKRGKNQSESFVAVLSSGFVSFSLILVISVVALFLLANYLINDSNISLPRKNISSFSDLLENGKYGDIPVKKLLGKNGWFEITNDAGGIVYSSLGKNANSYTAGELYSIQNLNSGETISVNGFETQTGSFHYLITKTFPNSKVAQYMLLDSDYRIISGTISTTKTQLTPREFELYTHNFYNEDSILSKFAFSADNGETYYAITSDTIGPFNRAPYIIVTVAVSLIFIFYVLLLLLFIKRMNKKVQKPLNALSSAMSGFAKDGYRAKLNYRGAREFEQLCNTFNEMVALLNASVEERRSLEQDKQRMLAGLSHDLKTPMTVIEGFSKAIRDGVVSDEDREKYIGIIASRSESTVELINEFCEYSKLDHPDFALDAKETDVAECVRLFLAKRYDEFEIQGYELTADITEEKLECMLDVKQAQRVLENLVSNIFKYNPKGTRVLFRVVKSDGNAEITVVDDGVGISESARQDIFKPFVVGDESRNRRGSGLGLAVCVKIVTAHGGTIALSDTPEDGFTTQFVITLPLCSETQNPDQAISKKPL